MKTTHTTKHEETSNHQGINRNSLPREAKKKAENESTLMRIDYENLTTKNAPIGGKCLGYKIILRYITELKKL